MSRSPEYRPDASAAQLAEWAERILSQVRQQDRQADTTVVLSRTQRSTLAAQLPDDSELHRRLNIPTSGQRTIRFTAEELAQLCRLLIAPLQEARGRERNNLLKAVEKVAGGLNACLYTASPPSKAARRRRPPVAYQLSVTLLGVAPPVWRRFQVLDCSLAVLHQVIQDVMGWQNKHLHAFILDDTIYSDPETAAELGYRDNRQTKLSQVVARSTYQFKYQYDFASDWWHTLEIESQFQPEADAPFPLCLQGNRSCPPENVGGADAYRSFLQIINDPEHELHTPLLDWCGGWFDPEVFDIDHTNRVLRLRAEQHVTQ